MPVDMTKLTRDKDAIISYISNRGPSLPVHIAKAANLSILFASAFLSELYSEGKIKMSNMKVGSSSLYFVPGQEAMLENSINYLNPKEKEAFSILKSRKILSDEEQVPAIRVALRSLKDFAFPLKIRINEEEKIFWKYFLVPDSELNALLQTHSKPKESPPVQSRKEESPQPLPESQKTVAMPAQTNQITQQKPVKKERKKEKEDSNFIQEVKDHLQKKDLEIISILLEKKKELLGIIRANSIFGKQEYYLIAKDKKKITESELDLALEKSQAEKMPVLIIAPGELDKKASARILGLRNLIKFINPTLAGF